MKVPNIQLSMEALPKSLRHTRVGGVVYYNSIHNYCTDSYRLRPSLYTNLVSIIRQEAPESSR